MGFATGSERHRAGDDQSRLDSVDGTSHEGCRMGTARSQPAEDRETRQDRFNGRGSVFVGCGAKAIRRGSGTGRGLHRADGDCLARNRPSVRRNSRHHLGRRRLRSQADHGQGRVRKISQGAAHTDELWRRRGVE